MASQRLLEVVWWEMFTKRSVQLWTFRHILGVTEMHSFFVTTEKDL